MKKQILFAIILLLLTSCRESPKNRAYILSYSGDLSVNGIRISSPGRGIEYGDIIETGKKSYCNIIIEDKNIIRLRDDAKLLFNMYGKSNELILEKGWLAAVIRKKFTSDGQIKLNTFCSTANIRGTSFCMNVKNDLSTYFCVCNGTAVISGKGDAGSETVTAAQHASRKFTIDKNTGFVTIDRDPGLLFHDSAELESMGDLIGEKIDWTRPDSF